MRYRSKRMAALSCSLIFVLMGFLPFFQLSEGRDPNRGDLEESLLIRIDGVGQPYNESVSYNFSKDAEVVDLDITISPAPYTDGGMDYPSDVWFNFSERRYFEFPDHNDEGYHFGNWGYQTVDIANRKTVNMTTSPSVTPGIKIALPKNASVNSATFDLEGLQRDVSENWMNYQYSELPGDGVGYSSIYLGDLNGNGKDEIITSAPWMNSGNGAIMKLEMNEEMYIEMIQNLRSDNNLGMFGSDISRPIDITGQNTMIAVSEPRAGPLTNGIVYIVNVQDMNFYDTVSGNDTDELFGTSVESCDMNGDGVSEVFVGAPNRTSAPGEVYVLSPDPGSGDFGDNMDLFSVIEGDPSETRFGRKIACGLFDTDSYEDVAVASDQKIRIYLGGETPNSVADYVLDPIVDGSVSDFKDIEILEDPSGTGPGTIAVGCPAGNNGKVLLYKCPISGPITMTQTINKPQTLNRKEFGWSISRICDYDLDDNPEFVVGAPGDSTSGGSIVIYELGKNTPEKIIDQDKRGSFYGHEVISCADVKGNYYPDFIVGAPARIDGVQTGTSSLSVEEFFDSSTLPKNTPTMSINGVERWTYQSDHLRGKVKTDDLSEIVNNLLGMEQPEEGLSTPFNEYVLLDITLTSENSQISLERTNDFILSGINITYDHDYVIGNLSKRVKDYILKPGVIPDESGYYHIPISVHSTKKGAVRISKFHEILDLPPEVVYVPSDITIEEDTHITRLVDLWEIFDDDWTPDHELNYTLIKDNPNATYANIEIIENRYLSVDLKNDTEQKSNDNWTGQIYVRLIAKDKRGHSGYLPYLWIDVIPVNDPPSLINNPERTVEQNETFVFIPETRDAEDQEVTISLHLDKPENMTLDDGQIKWTVNNWDVGIHNWTLELSDGEDSKTYKFTLEVLNINDPPFFISVPPKYNHAYVGEPFYFDFEAGDIDLYDQLRYRIVRGEEGAFIDDETGNFSFTPPLLINDPVKFLVRVKDSEESYSDYIFYVNVSIRLYPPTIESSPETELYDMVKWEYEIKVFDPNGEYTIIEVKKMPDGMKYDDIRNKLTWTPTINQTGTFDVWIKIRSSGYILNHSFTLNVTRAQREWDLNITGLKDGDTVEGEINIAGKVTVQPSKVLDVQIKIGDGEWMTGSLVDDTWSYRLDTTKLENGETEISVRAWDGYEYSQTTEITLNISNEKGSSILLTLLIILAIMILIPGAAILFVFVVHKSSKKRQEEEEKKKKMEELKSSKDDLESFLKEVGADNIPDDIQGEDITPMDIGDLISGDRGGGDESSELDNIFKDGESESLDEGPQSGDEQGVVPPTSESSDIDMGELDSTGGKEGVSAYPQDGKDEGEPEAIGSPKIPPGPPSPPKEQELKD